MIYESLLKFFTFYNIEILVSQMHLHLDDDSTYSHKKKLYYPCTSFEHDCKRYDMYIFSSVMFLPNLKLNYL